MANAPKPATVKKESSSSASNVFATLVIPICIVIGFVIWKYVLGDPSNFIDNNNENLPLPNNYPGTAYKGGPIVAILVGLLLVVIVFSIERFIVIGKVWANGRRGRKRVSAVVLRQNRVAVGVHGKVIFNPKTIKL